MEAVPGCNKFVGQALAISVGAVTVYWEYLRNQNLYA